MLRKKALAHLDTIILPYWKKLMDCQNGGYYGMVDFELNTKKEADKGVILNSRILWFFSVAHRYMKNNSLLHYAGHAYNFLSEHCIDRQSGGVYWMMSYDGKVKDDIKHTYNQAFAIYALCAYYEASGNSDALEQALDLFEIIEKYSADEYGYREAFTVDWLPIKNEKLSENGIIADKTMNTLLHVLEAYTELYKVSNNSKVKARLIFLLNIFKTKVYNKQQHRLEVFFDSKLNSLLDLQSFGHDIEASWLIDRACELVEIKDMSHITTDLVATVINRAYVDSSILNECFNGKVDITRIWWVQAEAVVSLLNKAIELNSADYHQKANAIFCYIEDKFVDKRVGGEWFWDLDENGNPTSEKPITEPWKCPYHNGRMCLEILRRLDK